MAEEAKATPEVEKITPDGSNEPKEGTVLAEMAKDNPGMDTPAPKSEPATETVPLSVYLKVKDEIKELRKEVRESKDSDRPSVILEGVKDLANKYPDVSEDFINDILNSATIQAQNKIDEKYSPIIQKQEKERQREAFDKAFDKVFDKALADNPELPKNVDKKAIKALALTPEYKSTPIAEILTKLYNVVETGKSASENETRTGADHEVGSVNFGKMTKEETARVMADPKTRQAYFNFLDSQ